MSSKEQGKRNPGQAYRGKPNRGKGPHPSTPSKSDARGDHKHPDNAKNQNPPGNKGKKSSNRNSQSSDAAQGFPQQGTSSIQNFASFISGITTGIQPGQSQINQSASITHISVNLQSSNFGPQVQPSYPPVQPKGNARRGVSRKPPNINQPLRVPSKESEGPTQLRVFTGSQESNSAKSNFKQLSHNPRANLFHQQMGTGSGEFNLQKANFRHPSPNPRVNVHHQQMGRGSQSVRPYHLAQNNLFRLSTQTHNQNSPQSNFFSNQNHLPHNTKQSPIRPHFFRTKPNEDISNQPKKFYNNVASPQDSPRYLEGQSVSATPVYKFTKNRKLKTASSQSNLNNEKQAPQVKAEKQRNANRHKKRQRKPNLWKKKTEKTEVAPLFSFQRIPTTSETGSKKLTDSDEEDETSMSRCSSEESVWTTNISDDGVEDSLSDESEVASEVTSEMSLSSSIKGSTVSDDLDSKASFVSKVDGFISVFWDIENCPVPREKSAVDFVKHVRTTFHEGRTEVNFYIVCDVTNLSSILTDELHLSDTTVIHMSNTNKNAADSKINNLLMEFRDGYKGINSAIVLISGDSDFSAILNSLRYKFHVHINLVCKANARHSLIEAAQKCVFYEDFVKGLPSRVRSDCLEYLIIVSNYPKHLAQKRVKAVIATRLKGVNCRVKGNNDFSVAVVLPDQCVRDKALMLLKGFEIDGAEIKTTCSERKKAISESSQKINAMENEKVKEKLKESEKVKEKQNENETVKEKENVNLGDKSTKLDKKTKNSENKDLNDDSCKGATLWVCVGSQLGDIDYWKIEFKKLWSLSDFSLQWEGSSVQGMFLVNFKSLSKAQKAKKVLQKVQKSDATCPKFLKLIKQDDISRSLTVIRSISDINRSKIEEHIQIIESKKEACLKKNKETVREISASLIPTVPGAAEAKAAKLNELNEQKVTFLNFTQNVVEKIKTIDVESEFIDEILALYLRDYSRECNCLSPALPIYAKKNSILKKIKKHQVVIIRAETGSGKSTQLTQYIWREDLSRKGLIICTQPRKIAAITLAKHVSSQVGYSLGEVVGYQVGLNSKKTANTAILYVTDFTMLKMMVDNDLKDVSCIIIDEAHERTVYTDLLLGMIKLCLKTRPDLKLIITSATIDTSVFKTYLDLGDESIMEISGRTFPVEDVWLDNDVALGWDYFKKTFDVVHNILNQEPGDVLAFLTTPFETEKAVKVFSEKLNGTMAKNFRILQLHGKLDVQEQQKVFERTPDGVRKIVFSTNCAETSITIPGIRYVVDCGMVKESQYDAVRNMNVLAVNFVSQSSAEQRRGRAGRTQVGKCYRLYSKANYDKMSKTSEPEILRVNLGQALLRLMKIGVKNPLQFDFVQSPPKESLVLTMKQLINLNAVNEADQSLSELGESMSCLPLEPRLSYLVLTGVGLNIGFEAVVLAALVTVSRNIFFRTAENRSDADVKKMRFCQSESDFLTYFEVYKEWATVPKQSKSKWCTLNCINARSLRTAQELVNELIHILEKEVKIKVILKFNDDSVHDTLLELVFRSFYQNLCIFSGYHGFGYKSMDVSGDLLIHPSSSLYTYGHWRPQYLVYDTILKTDRTYLINVSPVTKDTILDCMATRGIKIDMQALEAMQLTTYGISPLGRTIILHDIIGKQNIKKRQLENQLIKLIGTDQLAIEVDVGKGEVKVHGPQSKYEEIASILCPLIEKGQERLSREEKEVYIYPELCAIISAGIAIRDVVMPGEFRDIKVTLNTSIEISSVVEKFQTIGPVCTVREWKNYFKVSFLSPVHAKLALDEFKNDPSFSMQKIVKASILDGRINQYKVCVSFLRRECTGEAFVTIDTTSSVPDIVYVLNSRCIVFQNRLLKFSISRKEEKDVRIIGLPPNPDKKEFEKLVSSYIPNESKINRCVIVRKKAFESTSLEIENIKQSLIQMFSEFTSISKLSIDLKKPNSKDFTWNAFVFFQNACHGETSVSILKSRNNLSFTDLQMKPSLQTSLYCKLEVYWAIKNQIEEALNFFKENSVPGNTLEIKGFPKEGGSIQIQIISNNVSDISDARRSILNLILGDQIVCGGNEMLEKLFSNTGREYLKKITHENCYIDVNSYKKVITIFGDVSASNFVKLEINKFLDVLVEEHLEEINLMPEIGRPGVLRQLLSKYDHGLEELKEICGLTSIKVNSRQHILTVTGSSSAVTKCQDIINDLKAKLEDSEYEEGTELCPVCFDKVSDQRHRLEYCGHAYCKECLLHWFQNANDFPLNCITCNAPVVLADIQWASKLVNSFETEVFKKSLTAFIQSRSDVSYCPSPDCPMIFRVSTDGSIFECPSCNNSICTQCKELYHFGMSCSLYQCCKEDNDYSLKMWLEEDPSGRKQCPSCSSPIEKDGGCNHMVCRKCQCHMCWLCLQVFPTGDLVHNHQPYCSRE